MTNTIQDVARLPATDRGALERMLGQPLGEHEQVFIVSYTPNLRPDDAVRQRARAALDESFAAIDAHGLANGVTCEEVDAAIVEAVRDVRRSRR